MEMVESPKTISIRFYSIRWFHVNKNIVANVILVMHAIERKKYARIPFLLAVIILFVVFIHCNHTSVRIRLRSSSFELIPRNVGQIMQTTWFEHSVELLTVFDYSIGVWFKSTICMAPPQHVRNYNVNLIVSFSKNRFTTGMLPITFLFFDLIESWICISLELHTAGALGMGCVAFQ